MAVRPSNDDLSHLLAVVLAVVIVAALYFAKVVFVPLALAMLFAFVLTPLVMLLERAHLGRTLSTLCVILVVLASVGALSWMIANQFSEVINQLPEYQSNIEEKLDSLHLSKNATLRNASATVSEINKSLSAPPQPPSDSERPSARNKLGSSAAKPIPVQVIAPPALPMESLQNALGFLLQVLIVIVFTSFMLVQRESLRNRFISLVGQRQLTAMTQALDEASERVSRYLRTQLTVNAVYGTAIAIGLHFIGIPGALLWGVIVGILRFLPYVGPPLGGIMPVVLSLAIFHGWKMPLITLGMFVVVEVIVSHAIEPMLYGAHTGISSLAILVAAIFWTVLWGPVGLLLSTPLTVCIVVLGRYIPHLSFLPVLLGGNPVLANDALVYQRLLAMDQEEAEAILESLLDSESLPKVYDSTLIPALSMAEQDRHRGQIDDVTAGLIFQSIREIADSLHERSKELQKSRNLPKTPAQEDRASAMSAAPRGKILCVPARDEADELAAIMLAHVLGEVGENALCISQATPSELIDQVKRHHPDIVCVSALPPFVISHTRAICRAVKSYSPALPIMVGLWTFSGDTAKFAQRIATCDGAPMVSTLTDALAELSHLQKASLDPRLKTPVS